jgi:predicted nuclease of predicted toxin-antitoxin system
VRFLADESCDFPVVRALRAAGYDVLAVTEFLSGAEDAVVMDLALRERRILLTEDKDFGQLVYASAQPSNGVIFIRYPAGTRKTLPNVVASFIANAKTPLTGTFVVLSPGRVRIGGTPA